MRILWRGSRCGEFDIVVIISKTVQLLDGYVILGGVVLCVAIYFMIWIIQWIKRFYVCFVVCGDRRI